MVWRDEDWPKHEYGRLATEHSAHHWETTLAACPALLASPSSAATGTWMFALWLAQAHECKHYNWHRYVNFRTDWYKLINVHTKTSTDTLPHSICIKTSTYMFSYYISLTQTYLSIYTHIHTNIFSFLCTSLWSSRTFLEELNINNKLSRCMYSWRN